MGVFTSEVVFAQTHIKMPVWLWQDRFWGRCEVLAGDAQSACWYSRC